MYIGYCSLDGIEKICRSLPNTKAKAGQDHETRVLNITQCCPETPVLGGKSKIPSKFCPTHCEESTSLVPSSSCLVGCKKAGNINRFYDRTAGLFAVVRPCGVIVNFTEMFICESATQAYIFLYTTFGRNVKD